MSILITRNTRFIIQGITGREAVNLTRENLDYGAQIVGGVTPGRAGRDVYGVPVYDCVRDVVAGPGLAARPAYGKVGSGVEGLGAVTGALQAGDKVVVLGNGRVRPGAKLILDRAK